jgi:hypothetical protein
MLNYCSIPPVESEGENTKLLTCFEYPGPGILDVRPESDVRGGAHGLIPPQQSFGSRKFYGSGL